MLIILYDAQKELAYFEDLWAYFNNNSLNSGKGSKFVRINIPVTNALSPQAVQNIRLSLK